MPQRFGRLEYAPGGPLALPHQPFVPHDPAPASPLPGALRRIADNLLCLARRIVFPVPHASATAQRLDFFDLAADVVAIKAPLAALHGIEIALSGRRADIAADRAALSETLLGLVGFLIDHAAEFSRIECRVQPDIGGVMVELNGTPTSRRSCSGWPAIVRRRHRGRFAHAISPDGLHFETQLWFPAGFIQARR